MRLVVTLMTKEKISKTKSNRIEQIFSNKMASESKIFEYQEGDFFELDIDLLEINFSKDNIYDGIDILINICEEVLTDIESEIDFIIANDDTATEVDKYVKDWNDVKDFGLFVTPRVVPKLKPYRDSQISHAYLNFEYTSFGCIY